MFFYKLFAQKCSLSLYILSKGLRISVKSVVKWRESTEFRFWIIFFTLEQDCCPLTPFAQSNQPLGPVWPNSGQALSFNGCFGTGRWDHTVLFTCDKQLTLNSSEQFLWAKICFLNVSLVTDLSLSGQRADEMMGKNIKWFSTTWTLDRWKSTERCVQIVFLCL